MRRWSHSQMQPAGRLERRPVLGGRLSVLADRFSPVRFDSQALLTCVSPDLDLRYERVYAYLHDHVSRRRPSVDLLRLLCDGHGRLETRSWFTPGAPLRRRGLITLRAAATWHVAAGRTVEAGSGSGLGCSAPTPQTPVAIDFV